MEAILRQRRPPDGLTAVERVERLRAHLLTRLPDAADEIDEVACLFMPELARYGELIASSDGATVGLLTRGEDADLTARIARLMRAWEMPEETIAAAAHLARAFAHKRCFVKLEWRAGARGLGRAVAVYYRRRPSVEQAMGMLQPHAAALPLPYFQELARLLGKDTVHFVCLSAQPARAAFYKMYFSQYLIAETYDAARMRIARALSRFAPRPAAVARWAAYHDRLAPVHREQTVFVSLALTPHGLDPSIKIDYPDVAPNVAVGVLDNENQRPVAGEFERLCARAGRRALSFLGVRLGRAIEPVLKGYADFI